MECAVPFIEKFCQLAGVGIRRGKLEFIALIILDARLRCVGNNKPEGVQPGQSHVVLIVAVGIQRFADTGYNAVFHIGLPVFFTAQGDGIDIVLRMEPIQISRLNRLDNGDIAVENAFFVGDVHHIVYKPAQEVALAELDNPDRPRLAAVKLIDFLHKIIPFLDVSAFIKLHSNCNIFPENVNPLFGRKIYVHRKEFLRHSLCIPNAFRTERLEIPEKNPIDFWRKAGYTLCKHLQNQREPNEYL